MQMYNLTRHMGQYLNAQKVSLYEPPIIVIIGVPRQCVELSSLFLYSAMCLLSYSLQLDLLCPLCGVDGYLFNVLGVAFVEILTLFLIHMFSGPLGLYIMIMCRPGGTLLPLSLSLYLSIYLSL